MSHKARPASSVAHHGPPARWPAWGLEALGGLALGLILYFWIQPGLIYQNASAAIFNALPFSPRELLQPGRLFSQMLAWGIHASQFPALGAALGALLVWLICAAAGRLFWRGRDGSRRWAQWLFAPPLLAVLGRYDEAAAALLLGWAWASVLSAVAWWLGSRGSVWRWLGVCLGAAVVYLAAGAGPLCAYAVLLLLAAALAGRLMAWENLVLAVAVAAVTGLNAWLLARPWPRWFEPWLSPGWAWVPAVHALIFALVGVIAVRLACAGKLQPEVLPPAKPAHAHARKKGRERPALPAVLWLAGMAAGVVVLLAAMNDHRRVTLQLRALAVQEKWPEFLALARQQTYLEPATRLELVLALYHTGQLLEDWFAYPVMRQEELLPNIEHGPPAYAVMSRAMLALGQVNHAERYAAEALEILGPRPELLLVLAQVNVLKGHPVAAANFLRVLQRQPFHRAAATRWLDELSRDPLLEHEPHLQATRPLMVTTDYPHPENPTSPLMQQLLHSNPTNRMALEFLLAHDLVSMNLDKFMEHAERLRDPRLGYTALPRHVAEAALLWASIHKSTVPNLAGLQVERMHQERFARFDEMVRAHVQNVEAIRPRLAAEFGDTYWFFYLYGQSGRWRPQPGVMPP